MRRHFTKIEPQIFIFQITIDSKIMFFPTERQN